MRDSFPTVRMAVFVLGLWVAGNADAATIERYSDPVMGCTILLSGQIVEGDADRLEQLLSVLVREAQWPEGPGRLCLNSPGGSFLEGIRLARVIRTGHYFGTAIADGHVCESACAVAFLAGGWTEGDYDTVRPIMHPRARLGFHAPSIDIVSGEYSAEQVTQAWNIALQAVAEIVELRTGSNYLMPEMLFLAMLSTPPASMFYIDTVGRAASFDIFVFPSGVNTAVPDDAFFNLCDLGLGRNYLGSGYSGFFTQPRLTRSSAQEINAYFSEGFGEEAVGSCRVSLSLDSIQRVFQGSIHPLFVEYDGEENGGGQYARKRGVFPYMTFDESVRLDSLPTDIEMTWREFTSRVAVGAGSGAFAFSSCWLNSPAARVTNVTEYVNLRRQPDFSAPVVRQVPLGERVQAVRADNLTVLGQERDRQACINACQAFLRNAEDRTARDRAQQCIQENMLWYEITDARGNRGWVSRRFLEEVE
jgi:hypothetical protein